MYISTLCIGVFLVLFTFEYISHLFYFLYIFSSHMQESMRLSHSNNLYYPLANIGPVSRQPFSVTLALGEMVPIKPRRQIVYPEDLGINEPGKDVMRHLPMYTLYHTNRKLSLEPKVQ